eukprot:18462-Heterococcus_DN1.PRE.1
MARVCSSGICVSVAVTMLQIEYNVNQLVRVCIAEHVLLPVLYIHSGLARQLSVPVLPYGQPIVAQCA